MKYKKISLVFLLTLFLCAFIPSKSAALAPPSFDVEAGDYQFYTFLSVQNSTSAITGFTAPAEDTQWMVEVDVASVMLGWDYVNATIFKETGDGINYYWNTSDVFGSTSYLIGAYNQSISAFWVDTTFETIFPVPFIIPLDQQAVSNGLNQSLSKTFQNYVSENITSIMALMDSSGFPPMINVTAIILAWNGTDWYKGADSNQTVGPINGTKDYDTLLAAVYFDGWLNFLGEFWWDNSTFTWNTRYQLGTPLWEALGFAFASLIPGLGMDGSVIPGFPFGTILLGLLVSFLIIYTVNVRKRDILGVPYR